MQFFRKLNVSSKNIDKGFIDTLNKLEKEKIFTELDYIITEKEINAAIKTLKNNKSAGFDSIINEMLKHSQVYLLKCFKKLFNKVLGTGKFPELWAKGFIVPIYKNGPKDDPNNYRGITIGSSVGKLFSKILNTRLVNFITKQQIIGPEQIGFCKGKRTSDHMFVLKTLIDKYTKQGKKQLYTCFIDFKKAFDKVWHLALFYKLRKLGISDLFYNVIKDMYKNTSLCVKTDNYTLTENFPSDIGVRQGDNLSPTLFKLFIYDLPKIFDTKCCPVLLNETILNCLLYADDLILISETSFGLQNCLDKLSKYCKEWGLDINMEKTKAVVFNNTGRLSTEKFTFDGQPIDNEKKYNYLGMIFTASGKFTDGKQNLNNKALKAFFKLKKYFIYVKPNAKTLLHLFDHTIKPILLYGSEIWGQFPPNKLHSKGDLYFSQLCKDSIEKSHIKFCKYILQVSKRATNIAVMGELGRYPLYLEVLLNMVKYWFRLSEQTDSLIKEAFEESKNMFNKNKDCWYGSIKSIFEYLEINPQSILNLKTCPNTYLMKKLKVKYEKIWGDLLKDDKLHKHHGNKLRTYRLFKNNLCLEKYLMLENCKSTNELTKFRISAHDLEIEKGRYYNIPPDKRYCKLCKNDAVEDEIHFLLQCPKLETERLEFIKNISSRFINFKYLDEKSKFIWLMSNEDHFVNKTLVNMVNTLTQTRRAKLTYSG